VPTSISHLFDDLASGVRMRRVLPYLLEADDIGLEPIEPRHDLVPSFGPCWFQERVGVHVHHSKNRLGHKLTLEGHLGQFTLGYSTVCDRAPGEAAHNGRSGLALLARSLTERRVSRQSNRAQNRRGS
jgi:hypothetical protein